jgi:hypothetical protein
MPAFAWKAHEIRQVRSAVLRAANSSPIARQQERHPLLQLQRSVGNRAVLRLLQAERPAGPRQSRLDRSCACGGTCSSCRAETRDRDTVQRSPDKPTDPQTRHQLRIEELAKWPADAHEAWKGLDAGDRDLVIVQMAARYGSAFARKFLESIPTWKPKDNWGYYFGPDIGPKPEQLITKGYALAQKDVVHEWWVHPSGRSLTRNYTTGATTPQAPPAKQKLLSPRCKDVEGFAKSICGNTNHICELAKQLNDDTSRASCEKAQNSCKEANDRISVCVSQDQ